jgi:EpsI family protein
MPDKILNRRAAIAAVLMAAVAAGGQAMVPTKKLSVLRGPFVLADLVPRTFGDWKTDSHPATGIINPQTEEMLNRIYSQLLDRVYVDSLGHRIMMSVAYGDDQSDESMQMHYPEVCYPAQGFQLKTNVRGEVAVPGGRLGVKRLETQFGGTRFEPVTYWTIVGDQQSVSTWQRKVSEIRHGLKGEIIDGLLFRVSSIDRDSTAAFELQDRFISELVGAMSAPARRQLVGLD